MTKQERHRVAAIDIGSDTVHLLIADVRSGRDGGRTIRHVEQRSKLLELGRDITTAGRIGPADAAQVIGQVSRYLAVAGRAGAMPLVAATEAMRRAPDGELVRVELEKTLGLPVRLLSGRREAQLGFLAVQPSLEPRGPQLVIDSGGASTEVTLADGREAATWVSLPIGATVLAAALPGDPPSVLEWALEAVRVGAILSDLPDATPALAWATGGSAHNLIGLEGQREPGLPTRLSLADLGRLADELLHASARKLARRSGEDPRRVALLAPGALILAAVLRRYGLDWCTVLPAGLRDGMILAWEELGEDWWHEAQALSSAGPPAAPAEAPAPPAGAGPFDGLAPGP